MLCWKTKRKSRFSKSQFLTLEQQIKKYCLVGFKDSNLQDKKYEEEINRRIFHIIQKRDRPFETF